MSRLIDADEIKIRLPFILPPYNMMRLRNSIMQGIQDTPTVDAIPIAWLEDQAEDTTYQHRVDGLIERWRREHETDRRR